MMATPISDHPMGPPDSPRIVRAEGEGRVRAAGELFQRYADSLGFDLKFQDFDHELRTLPGEYAPPRGSLFLAEQAGAYVGCVGVRPLQGEVCEMKRLYLIPEARGRHLGRQLALAAIRAARDLGYRRMRLDTVGTMTAAIALYRELGFRPIPAYRHNPISSAQFFELDLERLPE